MKSSGFSPLVAAGFSLWLGHATHGFGALGIISTSLSPPSPVTGAPTFTGSPITVVPEPAVLALGIGGVLLDFRRRARRG